MNLKNLQLTSTLNMSREEWLAFRKPTTHVWNFIKDYHKKQVGGTWEEFIGNTAKFYEFLKFLFEQKEWEDFIFPCIGASEISSVVGLNQYKSIIELYYEKVGIKETFDFDNAAMYWGRELEAVIADKWQYWEGSVESLLENTKEEKRVRKCRRLNAYVQNKNFAWIFASLDRVINKQEEKEEGGLECKTISGYASDLWENGIPPMYVAQLQTQLTVCEFQHGEIAILKDGRDFQVWPFDYHEEICERLKRESGHFFQMVKQGVKFYILSKYAPENLKQEYLAAIDQFSPEPDGSLAYESYLKGAYREQGYEVLGGPVELHLARAYKFYDAEVKEIEAKQRECGNKLKGFLKDAACIDLGQDGKVTWRADAKGTRRFLVKVVPEPGFKPNPEIVKAEGEVKIAEPEVSPFD